MGIRELLVVMRCLEDLIGDLFIVGRGSGSGDSFSWILLIGDRDFIGVVCDCYVVGFCSYC